MKTRRILNTLFVLSLTCETVFAQDSLKSKAHFNYGLQANYGFVFAHSNDVENTANSFPRGITTTFNWQRTDKQILDQYNCFPRQSREIAFKKFSDNKMIVKYLEQGQ